MPDVQLMKLNAGLPTIEEWKIRRAAEIERVDRPRRATKGRLPISTPLTLQHNHYQPMRY